MSLIKNRKKEVRVLKLFNSNKSIIQYRYKNWLLKFLWGWRDSIGIFEYEAALERAYILAGGTSVDTKITFHELIKAEPDDLFKFLVTESSGATHTYIKRRDELSKLEDELVAVVEGEIRWDIGERTITYPYVKYYGSKGDFENP